MFLALAVPGKSMCNTCVCMCILLLKLGLVGMALSSALGQTAWITVAVEAGGLVDVTGERDTHNCPKLMWWIDPGWRPSAR